MTKKLRNIPPPTAHRFAAWLSLVRSLHLDRPREVRFPPVQDDIDALEQIWHHRLRLLQEAGVEVLKGRKRFERALSCKPYAFSYAGEGTRCRLPFCPWCNAVEAAEGYERLRRVADRHRKEIGFVDNRGTCVVDLSELPPSLLDHFSTVIEPSSDECLGSMVKFDVWPQEHNVAKVVLRVRVLHAMPYDYAKAVYDVYRKTRKPGKTRNVGTWSNVWGLAPESLAIHRSQDSAVRSACLSLASAAGRLCQYPAAWLNADVTRIAQVLNAIAGMRMSTVRGVFRQALPLLPERYPLQVVPTNPRGRGAAQWLMARLPAADEDLAAREFARLIGLQAADTFAGLSSALAMPVYFLGTVPITMKALARPTTSSELYQATAKNRPRTPGERHALVCVCPDHGLMVLSTWPPMPDLLSPGAGNAVRAYESLFLNVLVKPFTYTLETPQSFCHRWYWTLSKE